MSRDRQLYLVRFQRVVIGAQTVNVKTGDWLLIPPDTPHQPKSDPGGFSYMIMKISVGIYPWNLIR